MYKRARRAVLFDAVNLEIDTSQFLRQPKTRLVTLMACHTSSGVVSMRRESEPPTGIHAVGPVLLGRSDCRVTRRSPMGASSRSAEGG